MRPYWINTHSPILRSSSRLASTAADAFLSSIVSCWMARWMDLHTHTHRRRVKCAQTAKGTTSSYGAQNSYHTHKYTPASTGGWQLGIHCWHAMKVQHSKAHSRHYGVVTLQTPLDFRLHGWVQWTTVAVITCTAFTMVEGLALPWDSLIRCTYVYSRAITGTKSKYE